MPAAPVRSDSGPRVYGVRQTRDAIERKRGRLAGGEIWEGPEPVEERATNATRRAVALASRRMRDELGLDVDAGDFEEGETTVSGDPGPPLGAEWLDDLDGRRQTEPEAVIAELAAHLHRVEPALLPRALGIWGSALARHGTAGSSSGSEAASPGKPAIWSKRRDTFPKLAESFSNCTTASQLWRS